jgi:hypothetical protein
MKSRDAIIYTGFDPFAAELLKGMPVLVVENSTGVVYEVVSVSGDFIVVKDGDEYFPLGPEEYEVLVKKE